MLRAGAVAACACSFSRRANPSTSEKDAALRGIVEPLPARELDELAAGTARADVTVSAVARFGCRLPADAAAACRAECALVPVELPVSAAATAVLLPTAMPTPSANASAPTRPTYRA